MRKSPVSVMAGLERGRSFLREFRPGLIHSHGFHANVLARLLKLSAPSATVVSTVHNVYEGGWSRMLAYRLSDPLSRQTVAVSEAAASRFVRLKAVPSSKCLVIPNGIDTDEFAPNAERRKLMRAKLRAGNSFIWLAAARIVPAKDFPNLLRAFAQVYDAQPDARLWIAGDALSVEFDSVTDLAADLHLEASIRWLGLRRDMPTLLDAADAFVLSSAWEGMPLSVGEAMAMELPVVATDVGGVRELLGDTGLLVPPKSPDALAAAMLRLMQSDQEELQARARAARQRIALMFSMEARAEQWEALYRTVLEPGM